jgi:hypothetical protein
LATQAADPAMGVHVTQQAEGDVESMSTIVASQSAFFLHVPE